MESNPRAAIIDLDGTVYIENSLLPGAVEAIQMIRDRNIPHLFLTNNGSRTRKEASEFLWNLGAPIDEGQIITSSDLVARAASARGIDTVICVGGATGLPGSVADVGISAIDINDYDGTEDVCLAIGWASAVEVPFLTTLIGISPSIIEIFATDQDRVYPGPSGTLLPGTGWIVAAVREVLARDVTVCGKPNPEAFRIAAAQLGVPIQECVVIGDSLESDARPAAVAGAHVALLSGPVRRWAQGLKPEHTISEHDSLLDATRRIFG